MLYGDHNGGKNPSCEQTHCGRLLDSDGCQKDLSGRRQVCSGNLM